MKALTLYQPWASLVVLGEKKIETRSWQTRHTGPLAIHASSTLPPGFYDICDSPAFREALERLGLQPGRLPVGAVLGSVELLACVPTERLLEEGLGVKEQAFGDYGALRFGWLLQDALALPEPVFCRGHLWLWELPEDVLRKIHAHHRD
jgi:activating signal cointegrator 1